MNIDTLCNLRREEGKSLTVYEDSLGHLTVGVGHKVLPEDELKLGDKITENRCFSLLMSDLKRAEASARGIGILWMPSEVMDVLTEMVFQLGESGVRGFKRTLKALRERNYTMAALEMLNSRWAEQTPARAQRLAGRIKALDRDAGA